MNRIKFAIEVSVVMVLIGMLLFLVYRSMALPQEISPEAKVQALYGPGGFARLVGKNYQIGCTTPQGQKAVTASSKVSFDDAILISGVKPVHPKLYEVLIWVCNEDPAPAIAMQSIDNTGTCNVTVAARPGSAPIDSIILYMDGEVKATAASLNRLDYEVDLKKAGQGPHGLSAIATDTAGLTGSAVLAFTINKTRSVWSCQ